LRDKTIFFSLAYPSVVCCMSCLCGFLFLRWSSIYWCEQMWEILVVNREMAIPPRNYLGWMLFIWFSFFGLRPMYHLILGFHWFTVNFLLYFVSGIVVCLGFF